MRISITLQSDLCASAGKGWSSAIDNDVCFDEYGLPFIPARRVKGCLKAAASFIGCRKEDIDRVFGVGGAGIDGGAGLLRLSDARIENFSAVREDVRALHIPPDVITDMFCDVRSSTQIEDDTAKDNTLRFVRVVSRLSPLTTDANDGRPERKPLVFFCDVSLDGDENDVGLLETCCKALRNMGYKRNRGLGAVRCALDRTGGCADGTIPDFHVPDAFDPEKDYLIRYKIRFDADVAVSRGNTGDAEDYIPGAAVLGAIAGRFNALSDESKPSFNDVFYSGRVKFCNLYITDKYGETAYPAPFYLGKYKDGDDIVNMLSPAEHPQGKIPKPFKNGYLSRYARAKVAMKVTYHHAHDERILYTQRCMEAGQVFSGRIYASGQYAGLLVRLLRDRVLSIGRSKTAQYATCRIVSLHCDEAQSEKVRLERGRTYAAVLRSDFLPSFSGRVPDSAGLLREIIGADAPAAFEKAFLLTRTAEGYNAKWNLKRPHRTALKAGSTFVFRATDDFTLPSFTLFAGENRNEGYGMIDILPDARDDFRFAVYAPHADARPDTPSSETADETPHSAMAEAYRRRVAEKRILSLAVAAAASVSDSQLPHNAQIGRLSLMADNSLAKLFTKEEMKAAHFRWKDFEKRVDSIKSQSAKETALTLVRKFSQTVADAFEGSDPFRLQCMILFLHILRYRSITIAAEKRGEKNGKEDEAE